MRTFPPRILAVLAIAVALLPLLARAEGPEAPATTVQFVDSELERSVRQALQKPSGPLTVAEMESLTVLDARLVARGVPWRPLIRSIVGLEFAVNLKELHLGTGYWCHIPLLREGLTPPPPTCSCGAWPLANVSITDFSPLSSLTQLEVLELEQNDLADGNLVAVLPRLSRLHTLNLGLNRLTNVALAQGLTSLRFLDLSYNRLSGHLDLRGLERLEALELRGNPELTVISLPNRMPHLKSLNLIGTGLTNVVLPANLGSLQELQLDGFDPSRNQWSAEATNLLAMRLNGFYEVSELGFLPRLTRLEFLELRARDLTRFPPGLTNLVHLQISGNDTTVPSDSSFLSGMLRLMSLGLSYVALTNFVLPASPNTLELVSLLAPRVTELALPPGLDRLKSLMIDAEGLTHITLSTGLTSLNSFSVRGPLTNLFLPTDVTRLESLTLTSNRLTSLDIASCRESLTWLDISNNRLTDFEFLKDFRQLAYLLLVDNGPEGKGLDRITLPWGLTNLEFLHYYEPDGTRPSYLGVPFSTSRLVPGGFPGWLSAKEINILGVGLSVGRPSRDLWSIPVSIQGARGKRVAIQRSGNLADWETVLETTTWSDARLTYDGPFRPFQFYRAVEIP